MPVGVPLAWRASARGCGRLARRLRQETAVVGRRCAAAPRGRRGGTDGRRPPRRRRLLVLLRRPRRRLPPHGLVRRVHGRHAAVRPRPGRSGPPSAVLERRRFRRPRSPVAGRSLHDVQRSADECPATGTALPSALLRRIQRRVVGQTRFTQLTLLLIYFVKH